jgi:hypothetical protein
MKIRVLNTPSEGGSARHHIHHPLRLFFLHEDVVRTKECGATYQRCMQFCFKGQIGCNLQVYIDDIVIKSQRSSSLIADLEETFNNLKRFNIKLNLEKCTFRVPLGKLLRYIITERIIKANPDKISAITKIG